MPIHTHTPHIHTTTTTTTNLNAVRTKYRTTTDGHLIKMEKESDEEEGSVHSSSQSYGRHHDDHDELSPHGFTSPGSSSGSFNWEKDILGYTSSSPMPEGQLGFD